MANPQPPNNSDSRWRQTVRFVRENPLVLPLYLPSLIYAIAAGLLIPILPLFARDLTSSYQLIGLMLAGDALGKTVGDVPAGLLVQKWGLRRTMLVGLLFTAVSTGALFLVNSVALVFLLRFVAGFSEALYNIGRHTYLADAVKISGRGRAIALFGGVFRFGNFFGPALGGFLAAWLGLRAPFLAFALLGSAALLVLFFFLHSPPSQTERLLTHSSRQSLWLVLTTQYRTLLTAGSGQLLGQMVRTGRKIIVPLFGADFLGLSVQEIGLILSAAAAVDVLFFWTGGLIMDGYGRKWAIVPSFVLQGVGLFAIPFTTGFWTLLIAVVWVGLANSISSGTMMTLGADLAPLELRSEYLGSWRLIGDAGMTAAPLLVGQVAQLLALPTAVLALALTGFLASAVFGLAVPETLVRDKVTNKTAST